MSNRRSPLMRHILAGASVVVLGIAWRYAKADDFIHYMYCVTYENNPACPGDQDCDGTDPDADYCSSRVPDGDCMGPATWDYYCKDLPNPGCGQMYSCQTKMPYDPPLPCLTGSPTPCDGGQLLPHDPGGGLDPINP